MAAVLLRSPTGQKPAQHQASAQSHRENRQGIGFVLGRATAVPIKIVLTSAEWRAWRAATTVGRVRSKLLSSARSAETVAVRHPLHDWRVTSGARYGRFVAGITCGSVLLVHSSSDACGAAPYRASPMLLNARRGSSFQLGAKEVRQRDHLELRGWLHVPRWNSPRAGESRN